MTLLARIVENQAVNLEEDSKASQIEAWYAGKRVLITGAGGYLATALTGVLQSSACRIVRLVRSPRTMPAVAGVATIDDMWGDIRDRKTWDRVLPGVDVVFHLAAQTSAYTANADPALDLAANVVPMVHLLEVCRLGGCRPAIVFASTVTIAGIPTRLPVDEAHPDRPATVYDLHKLMAEQYLRYYVNDGVVRGTSLRLVNMFGPGPRSSRPDRGVLNQMIRKAVAGEALTVYGPGDRLRDYLYVDDAARAFLEAARHMDAVNGQHFVIGSERGHTIADACRMVAQRVEAKTGKRVAVEHVEPPAPLLAIEERDFVADSSRFRSLTGWRARYSLREGIDRAIEALS